MAVANIEIVGVYPIAPTEESIVAACRYHGYDYEVDENGRYLQEILWETFENLVLIEARVLGAFSMDDFEPLGEDDQAPYDEFYLDSSGTRTVSEAEAVSSGDFRVCYFLHFANVDAPLTTNAGSLQLPRATSLPERLVPFTHYVPPN